MKPLILDHLKRWGWVWALIGIIQFGLAFNVDAPMLSFQLPVFLGAFLLMFDLQRGHGRVLLTLPVSARQVARAWWWMAVGLPASLLTVIISLAAIVAYLTGVVKEVPYEVYGFNCLLELLLLGSLFLVLAEMPSKPPVGFREMAQSIFFSGLWGLSFAGGLFLAKGLSPSSTKRMLVLVFGTAMTITGWFRAEHLVSQRSRGQASASISGKGRSRYDVQKGFGGLPFLIRYLFIRVGGAGLLFLGAMVLMSILTGGPSRLSRVQLLEYMTSSSMPFMFVPLIFLLLPIFMNLRLLRTLPISSAALSATLVFCPAVSIVALGALVAILTRMISEDSTGLLIPQDYLLGLVLISIGVPLIVWRGLSRGTYLMMLLTTIMGSMLFWHLSDSKASLFSSFCISIPPIVLAFAITRRLLVHSSEAYRVRPTTFNWWQGIG